MYPTPESEWALRWPQMSSTLRSHVRPASRGADGDTLENEDRSSPPPPPAGRESPDRGVTTDLGSDETARRVRVRDEGGSDERRRVQVAALLQKGDAAP